MNQEQPNAPWWKHGYVWLVIAGPAVVVVAALATAWIAARSPDPVLGEDRRATAIEKSSASARALMPALQGRNHAATPAPAR
jgi:uncharacterized protein